MIELKPNIFNKFTCPECKSSSVEINDIVFPGIHILADCKCSRCQTNFYADFPIGHALFYPLSFNKETLKLYYDNEKIKWISEPLVNSYLKKNDTLIIIQKKIFNEAKEVILLNCIDYLYGHVLLKLFNSLQYLEKHKNLGLIIIIPKQFEWLVPGGVSEVWTVDIKLNQARDWFVSINTFISYELKRFSKVYLSLAFSHPEFDSFNIEKFTGIKPFNIHDFSKKIIAITFIYREDRLWTSGKLVSYISNIINQIPSLKLIKRFLILNQNRKIVKTFYLLKKIFPKAVFNIAGVGTVGKYPSFINDVRKNEVDVRTEKLWCKIYSESHLVIGIHGSNMLIPTSLAAGFIELLPVSRDDNFLQDIARSFNNRMDVFLGRFCHEHIVPSELAVKAASIIKTFPEAYIRYNSSFLEHKVYNDTSIWKLDGK